MTAPRACRACGAPLPGDVRWCLRCYTPVRELTPREPQLPPVSNPEEPPATINRSPLWGLPPPVYSRWRAGPTTFGPVGRITITVLVLVAFPWGAIVALNPFQLWYALGYTIFATYVLRSTWRRDRVASEARSRRFPATGTSASLWSRHVDARIVTGLALVGVGGAIAYAWTNLDAVGRYGVTAVAVVGAVALALSWWTEV
jgi:hypothetical protein